MHPQKGEIMKRLYLVVAMCVATVSGMYAQASLVLAGSDNQTAVNKLYDWLNASGIAVSFSSSGSSLISRDGVILFIEAKMSDDSVDRLVFTSSFGVKDEFRGSSVMIKTINETNRKYNIGSFYTDSDGDMSVQGSITFVDYIDRVEIEKFMAWFKQSLVVVIMGTDLMNYLN